jgi:hypothetical protein
MTGGERHLRKEVSFSLMENELNLGDFDWTVEFWLRMNSGANLRKSTLYGTGFPACDGASRWRREVAHAFQRVKRERISYQSSCARKRMPLC